MALKRPTPPLFLLLATVGGVVVLFSPAFWLYYAIAVLFISFRIRLALPVAILFLICAYISSHGAFILDKSYTKSRAEYYTTKGYQNKLGNSAEIGDFIWADFERQVVFSPLPREGWKELDGEYKRFHVPIISSILKLRHTHSSLLLYRSGGVISTSPAHVFAIDQNIPKRVKDEYIITGLAHLLAMSGSNVAIFVGGCFILLAFLPIKLRCIPIIVLLPLLIPLSGFAITVIRAVIFAMVYLVAFILDLKVKSLNFLAALAGTIVLFSPFSLYSVSFQLSFFAVFGILSMIKRRHSAVSSIALIGVAATIFTMPIQAFYFGTANALSIVTTVIFTPVVWVQTIFTLLTIPFPNLIIPALANVEIFAAKLMNTMAQASWHLLFISKPPAWILATALIIAFMLAFTKFRALAIAMLFIPLLPIYERNVLIFPQLPPSPKGYVMIKDGVSEIFYQGMHYTFVRDMVPAAARLGIKQFDYGSIRIFDGENLYIRLKNDRLSGAVCINEQNDSCEYAYYTRSNTLKPPLNDNIKLFVLYKNSYTEDERILLTSEKGEIIYKIE